MRPLIGITTANYTNEYGWDYNIGYTANAKAIVKAGGLPVFVPISIPESAIQAIYDRLDGVLLSGGGDIDPSCYGAEPHPLTAWIDNERDAVELNLVKRSLEDDLPLLGICRGHQMLNVALGGQLVQDVATELQPSVKHDFPLTSSRRDVVHTVTIDEDSRLRDILGDETVQVNSLHHQAVVKAGESAKVIGRSADGLIEAVEIEGKTFAISVQWHPEDLVDNHGSANLLFEAFIQAASRTPQE